MFSHQVSVRPQLRQWERGLTMLSPSGQRLRQTLRKLPKARPASAAKAVIKARSMCGLSLSVCLLDVTARLSAQIFCW